MSFPRSFFNTISNCIFKNRVQQNKSYNFHELHSTFYILSEVILRTIILMVMMKSLVLEITNEFIRDQNHHFLYFLLFLQNKDDLLLNFLFILIARSVLSKIIPRLIINFLVIKSYNL